MNTTLKKIIVSMYLSVIHITCAQIHERQELAITAHIEDETLIDSEFEESFNTLDTSTGNYASYEWAPTSFNEDTFSRPCYVHFKKCIMSQLATNTVLWETIHAHNYFKIDSSKTNPEFYANIKPLEKSLIQKIISQKNQGIVTFYSYNNTLLDQSTINGPLTSYEKIIHNVPWFMGLGLLSYHLSQTQS